MGEFEMRRVRNPRYSLRAFARLLELNPATLSKVLNKKRGLSYAAALKIADKLELNAETRAEFINSVESLHARSPIARAAAKKRIKGTHSQFETLDLAALEVLEDWRHFAILETLTLPHAPKDALSLAGALKLPLEEIQKALVRLEKVGLLSLKDGRIRVLKPRTWGPDDVPSETIKSYHRGLLSRSTEALSDPMDERDFSALILSIDPSRWGDIKSFLRNMHRQFSSEFESSPQRSEVIALTVQCVKLNNGVER